MLDGVSQFIGEISRLYGTGDMSSDAMSFTLIVSFIALMVGIISYRKERSIDTYIPSIERIQGMNGKLEKMERTLNEFRSDMLKNSEIAKAGLEFTKTELIHIREALTDILGKDATKRETPPSGSQNSSGESSRGGSGSTSGGGLGAAATKEISAQEVTSIFEAIEKSEAEKKIPEPSDTAVEEGVKVFVRLRKTRESLINRVKSFFTGKTNFDQSMIDQLEETLISSDIGVKTSLAIIKNLQAQLTRGEVITEQLLLGKLREHLQGVLAPPSDRKIDVVPERPSDGPYVVMLVGVNGAGKTTTVAKLAHQWRSAGRRVMVAAADTFRAAAVDQLQEWANRIDVPVIFGAEGAKPATVVYDAMVAAKKDNIDILIIDTAGRLQNKSNLMQELEGIRNVMSKHQSSAPHDVLLVVDGSSGQNALMQAQEFNSVAKLTGIVITKLDGTPKGGIVVAIKSELGIPIRYIGIGEKREDLKLFESVEFVDALLGIGDGSQDKYSFANAIGPKATSETTSFH